MTDLYTHSRLACFRACPRRHEIRYQLGLAPAVMPDRVGIGIAYHLAHWQGELVLDQQPIDPYIRECARAMYRGWTPRLVSEYVAVEMHGELDLPASRRVSSHVFAGALDAVVRLTDGRLAVLERKTAARIDDTYWRRVELDSQIAGYFALARIAGLDVQTVVYDVAQRPGIMPLRATPPEKRKLTKDGRLYANQRDHDETPEGYGTRCAEHLAYDMREVAITEQRMREWERDAAETICAIEARFAYRVSAACAPTAGSVCDYLSICHRSDLDTHTPEGYVRLTDVHPELAAREASPATSAVHEETATMPAVG